MTDKELRAEIIEGIVTRCQENCEKVSQEQCDQYVKRHGDDACKYCGADQVIDYLHSKNVVIKVDTKTIPLKED